MKKQKQFRNLAEKIEKLKKTGEVDLSTEEDLSIAIMNLISLEEHMFFTGEKTGKSEYFDLLQEIRSMRKDLLGRMINKHEGETWCISKHLLAVTMRLTEVGTKLDSIGKRKEAKEMFDKAYKAYTIFWGIRLKLLKIKNVKKSQNQKNLSSNKPWTLKEITDKLVDCCDE